MNGLALLTPLVAVSALLVACPLSDEGGTHRIYERLERGDSEFATFPAEFDEFAIYWVGDEFGGHELRRIIRNATLPQDILRGEDSVRFLYGTCEIVGDEGGCPPPLQIIVQPYCQVPPELIGDGTRPPGIQTVRGNAESVGAGGGLRLWTGDVTIKVYTSGSSPMEAATLMDSVIAALESPNGLGVAAGEDMPAPDAQCPPYATPDLSGLND